MKKVAVGVIIAIILTAAFIFGGSGKSSEKPAEPQSSVAVETETTDKPYEPQKYVDENIQSVAFETDKVTKSSEIAVNEPIQTSKPTVKPSVNTQKPVVDKYMTEPVPENKPTPVEPQEVAVTKQVLQCTVSISCNTVLHNFKSLDKKKKEIIPEDGIILPVQTVEFNEGESVFDLLLRIVQKNNIHMEYQNTPIYNSAYIEGIGNLYEFDCGELSGWMYKVNDWFPNYGCSRYSLKSGDKVEFVYTCDLGRDVGGDAAQLGERK